MTEERDLSQLKESLAAREHNIDDIRQTKDD